MSKTVIKFENVSKKYHLGYMNFNGFMDFLPKIINRIISTQNNPFQNQNDGDFYALKDISFELKQGEALGIVGPNGAGKSTILKLLAHTIEPTSGKIITVGKISALIELGAGFHHELTGRENIYLYGSIMGLRRKEIKEKFESIVAFAELEKFIDTPVKHYSSGMYARLGFAVAIHVDPDILLIDEVLAVGDMSFRKKCQEKMHAFLGMGKSIVFVSHNIYAIQALCKRTIYLSKGQIQSIGNSKEVIGFYINETNKAELKSSHSIIKRPLERWGTGEAQIISVEITDKNGIPKNTFRTGDTVRFAMNYKALIKIPEPDFHLLIQASGNIDVTCISSARVGYLPEYIEGEGKVEFAIESIPFLPRTYSIFAKIRSLNSRIDYDTWQNAAQFVVAVNEQETEGLKDSLPVGDYAIVHIPYRIKIF